MIGKELFGLLRETHGKEGFQSLVDDKVVPLAGDIVHENFGVEGAQLAQMTREINVIVNGAATTNFYERSAGRPAMGFLLLKRNQRTLHCRRIGRPENGLTKRNPLKMWHLKSAYLCRYDVALDVNVMGVRHMCQLARQCPNLEVILHVSTGKKKFLN